MRTRSQGPSAHADRSIETPVSVTSSGNGDAQKGKRKELGLLTPDAEVASTRSSFEAPLSTPDANLEARKWNLGSGQTAVFEDGAQDARVTSGKDSMVNTTHQRRKRPRSPWSCSTLTLFATALASFMAFVIVQSFLTRQLDSKGCAMSYMAPAFAKFSDFDTEHTRFASKYSLYLYRERGIDEDTKARRSRRRLHVHLMLTLV